MIKKSYYFIFIFICIFCCIIRVDAEETFSNTVCNIGSTDGLLYSNDWSFVLIKPPVNDLPSNIDLDNNKDNDMDLSGCIIDKGTQSIIDWIMNLVRIGGVILLVVLGMLDFVKAAASGEQEEVKKSKSKFVKRLIACVVLFFVPIIVKILVGLVNLGSGESCKSNNTHQSNSGDTQNGGSEKS